MEWWVPNISGMKAAWSSTFSCRAACSCRALSTPHNQTRAPSNEGRAYLKAKAARVFSLPESVDDVDLDEVPDVIVKCGHEEIDIVQIVELPAFGDERISQHIFERHRFPVGFLRKVTDPGQLEGGFEEEAA